jgi:3-hydroxy-9,10-secoandrosta-1,3,5(10)-triene-9,17-dione monooxygenase reductase component
MNDTLDSSAEELLPDLELVDPFSGLAHRRSRLPQRNVVPVMGKVINTFPAGVAIVAAQSSDGPMGLTVGTISRLSSDPPLLLFSVSNTSGTWRSIHIVGAYCVSLLSEDQAPIAAQFASGDQDRFAGVKWCPSLSLGMPAIDDSLAYFECALENVFPGGDHLIVVGRAVNVYYQRRPKSKPLLSYRHQFWTLGETISSVQAARRPQTGPDDLDEKRASSG